MSHTIIESHIRPGRVITAVQGTHPDVPNRQSFWVEINGKPLRMSQGGVITYPSASSAAFAAAVKARKKP